MLYKFFSRVFFILISSVNQVYLSDLICVPLKCPTPPKRIFQVSVPRDRHRAARILERRSTGTDADSNVLNGALTDRVRGSEQSNEIIGVGIVALASLTAARFDCSMDFEIYTTAPYQENHLPEAVKAIASSCMLITSSISGIYATVCTRSA